MSTFTIDKSFDYQLVKATFGGKPVYVLFRTVDGLVSVCPDTGESPDQMVANFQRVIDTLVFGAKPSVTNLELVSSFHDYVPDYIPLEDVVVIQE